MCSTLWGFLRADFVGREMPPSVQLIWALRLRGCFAKRSSPFAQDDCYSSISIPSAAARTFG